jgi:hypothetical protein
MQELRPFGCLRPVISGTMTVPGPGGNPGKAVGIEQDQAVILRAIRRFGTAMAGGVQGVGRPDSRSLAAISEWAV